MLIAIFGLEGGFINLVLWAGWVSFKASKATSWTTLWQREHCVSGAECNGLTVKPCCQVIQRCPLHVKSSGQWGGGSATAENVKVI